MRRNSGFTLVEMVVSLTILSLLTLATLTALRTLADTQTRLETTVGRLDEMRLVGRFLRGSLRQAEPVNVGLYSVYFEGERDSLSWVAPLQGVEGVAGMQYMRLSRREQSLLIQFLPYQPGEPAWEKAKAHTLLDTLQTFEVSYRAEPGEPWTTAWEPGIGEVSGLPQAVKLRIRSRDRYWPDLVVALDQSRANW